MISLLTFSLFFHSLLTTTVAFPSPSHGHHRSPPPSTPPTDGPYVPLASPNAPSNSPWQWWYFDMVSTTTRASLQITYYSAYGFGVIIPNEPFYVQITGNYPNGTYIGSYFAVAEGSATVNSGSGNWPGAGSWTSIGEMDCAIYTAKMEIPGVIEGQIELVQTAPSHYPCNDPNAPDLTPGAAHPNLAYPPALAWSIPVPGALATASLTVQGQTFTFFGTGYHDTNWGLTPITPQTASGWFWGRGTLGPYTFSFSIYSPPGTNALPGQGASTLTAGYLAEGSTQLLNFCSAEQSTSDKSQTGITFETSGNIWGSGSTGAGLAQEGVSEGITVTFKNGGESWTFQQTSRDVILAAVNIPYSRWTSTITGGPVGAGGRVMPSYSGDGVFEILEFVG